MMKKTLSKSFGNVLIAAFLLIFAAGPVCLYMIFALGWPPVIGNLFAAGKLRTYAAQVYPGAEGGSCWAGYNLVDGCYYLDVQPPGGESRSLRYDADTKRVMDRERSEALRQELGIDQALRVNGLRRDSYYCYWGASWFPQTPEEAYISLRLDFYDPPEAPVPDEGTMRETMAEEGMRAYDALSPLAPVHSFSVHYCHQGVEGEGPGLVWNIVQVDLPAGIPLTREMLLSGKLIVK
ncbi:MAG: hypothetical protein OSJ58_05710 [Dysosmobacter sp.]|nr:hypothetical protein [Dysosmobacter sp.]